MRVLVTWMTLRLPHRTKFRVFTGKAYIATDNADAAARFVPALEATCAQLAALPGMGSSRTFRNTDLNGVRMMPVSGFEHYLIFYVAGPRSMKVLRILHTSHDFPTIFN